MHARGIVGGMASAPWHSCDGLAGTSPMGAPLCTPPAAAGKSWWIWCAVHRLLNQSPSPAIVWQTFMRGTSKCVLFRDGKAFIGDLTKEPFTAALADASTW